MSKIKDGIIVAEEANIFLLNAKNVPLTTTEIIDYFVESKQGERVFDSMIEQFTSQNK